MELLCYGRKQDNVFSLYGTDENSATYAVGMGLLKSPSLMEALVANLLGCPTVTSNWNIHLQEGGTDRGFTDIQFGPSGKPVIIVEAKKGWWLPTHEQLAKYAERMQCADGCIVSLSAASREYAERGQRLPESLNGHRVIHRSWADLRDLVNRAMSQTRKQEEKIWLRELENHLRGYATMQDPKDNNVFVVSLSRSEIKPNTGYTWVNVVEDGYYFHPVGNRWPVVPPNYIGIRYEGRLQSVHHVESFPVHTNLEEVDPRWPHTESDHFVYKLGPAMKPAKPVQNGKIYPSGRYWCAIDTLLSGAFDTISAARDETQRRLLKIGVSPEEDSESQ